MKTIEEQSAFLKKIMDMLENHFGRNCEILLHDYSKGYDQSLVDIRNGYITGRAVGACGSNLGLEVLRGTTVNGDRYNYITHTKSGKILRSSTTYIYNDENVIIGAICLNSDITESVKFENYLRQINNYDFNQEAENEIFATDVQQLLDELIKQALRLCAKSPELMTREDKMAFIKYLDEKGVFIITKSSERVCEQLNISKYTFYHYLDLVRKESVPQEESVE